MIRKLSVTFHLENANLWDSSIPIGLLFEVGGSMIFEVCKSNSMGEKKFWIQEIQHPSLEHKINIAVVGAYS